MIDRVRASVWLCVLVLLGAGSAWAQTKSVMVLATDREPRTQAMQEGLRDALKVGGFVEGRQFKFVTEVVATDEQSLAQRTQSMAASRPDVLVALSIPAAQSFIQHTKQIPIVFAGVTDPVKAELVPSWAASGTTVTGVSDLLPMARRVALIRQVVPQARRVGVVYNPSDAASVAVIREFQELVSKAGMLMVEVAAPRAIDVPAAARSLLGKVDVLHTFWDSNTQASYAGLVKVANDAKIVLLASDTASLRLGASAALVIAEREIGAAAGRQVVRILRGTKPGTITPEVLSVAQTQVNLVAAKLQGLSLSDALMKTAVVIVK